MNINNIMDLKEASIKYDLNLNTLKSVCQRGLHDLVEGVDYRKSGSVWLITDAAIEKILNKKDNNYKITLYNLGYTKTLQKLNGATGDLPTLINKIKRMKKETSKKIEGYPITNINYNINENDFKKENTINIIETNDYDRCICISKIN